MVAILIIAPVLYYYMSDNYVSQMNINSSRSNNYSSYFYLNSIPIGEVASYKASCKNIDLTVMMQNPDSYKGQKIIETGQIYNMTINDDGVTEMLLNTPETTSDLTRLFVTYKGTTPYSIGDNIAAYGEEDSFTVYNIKMPFLKSVYIEKT